MSRARNVANLASGISASDIATGTLGNTVQDNITRLGTVTTGTLSHGTTLQGYVDSSNTGVTFPTGTPIQVVSTSTTNTYIGLTTSVYPIATGFKLSITPKYQTSKILVIFNVLSYLFSGTNAAKMVKLGIRLNSQSNTLVAPKRFSAYDVSSSGSLSGETTLIYVDDHDSTTSQEYELVHGAVGSTWNNYVSVNGGSGHESTIILMEIA